MMTSSSSKPNLLFFTIFFFFFFLLISTRVISLRPHQKVKDSFTINIIHRDSPKSPLFDNTTTHFQRIHNALLRSEQRMNYLFPSNASTRNIKPQVPLLGHAGGEYIMQYSLGVPMFTTYGVIDTGSDFTWLQCIPATSSYDQGPLEYLNTNLFRALVPVHFVSQMCNQVVRPSVTNVYFDGNNCQCKYMAIYGDSSGTSGHVFYTLLRLQTILGTEARFPMFVFGCSREVTGTFSPVSSGIVGLGRGPASLVTQIYDRIDGKFGFCLVPVGQNQFSEMKFGQSAVVFGPDVVYTPMIAGEPVNYYHISLEGISVGNRRISYTTGVLGNMVIDSGTVVTRLPPDLYAAVEAEVEAELDLLHTRTHDPLGFYNLCYSQTSIEAMGGPSIIIHIRGGDLVLSAENVYIMVAQGTVCFNFKPQPMIAILGTTTLANFMVTYDLQRIEISFKKMNCAISN